MNWTLKFPGFRSAAVTLALLTTVSPALQAAPELTPPSAALQNLPEKTAKQNLPPAPVKNIPVLREYAWMQDNPLQPVTEKKTADKVQTLLAPTPPDGNAPWISARSNGAFSFLKECSNGFEDCRLWLRENAAQEIKLLAEAPFGNLINDTFDVDPRGSFAIFETADPQNPGSLSIHLLALDGSGDTIIPQTSYSDHSLFGIHFTGDSWNPSGGGSVLLETLVFETPEDGQQGLFKPAPYLVMLGDLGPRPVALKGFDENPRYAFYAGAEPGCSYHAVQGCPSSLIRFDMGTAEVQTLPLDGTVIAVSYRGSLADLTLRKNSCTSAGNCQNRIFRVTFDLMTLEEVPGSSEEWTPARSNPDFAFRLDGEHSGNPRMLRLLDLKTQAIRELVTYYADIYGGIYSRSFPGLVFDVSPDGARAVFERVNFRYYDDTHEIFVQPLNTPEAVAAAVTGISSDSRGILKKIVFENGGIRLTAQITDMDGTVFEKQYQYSYAAASASEIRARLVTGGRSVYFERSAGLLIYFPHHASLEGFEIYQMVRGTSELRHLLHVDVPLALDHAAEYETTLMDIYKTFQGQRMISVGVKTAYGTQTIVVDVGSKTVKRFEGAAYRVRYTRFWAFYWVRYLDDSFRILRVRLPLRGFPWIREDWRGF